MDWDNGFSKAQRAYDNAEPPEPQCPAGYDDPDCDNCKYLDGYEICCYPITPIFATMRRGYNEN